LIAAIYPKVYGQAIARNCFLPIEFERLLPWIIGVDSDKGDARKENAKLVEQ
jgi:hypothetical protein